MRARLLLSVAITALSLGIPQSYAQNATHDQPGGEPQKPAQGEPAARQQKPAEHGARERHGEMQNRERGEAKGEREATSPGANESAEKAARQEERRSEEHGAAVKHGGKKGEKHGAANERLDRTPGAQAEQRQEHGAKQKPAGQPGAETQGSKAEPQGAKEAEKQEKTGRVGARPTEGPGSTATENERRGERAASPEERNKATAEQQAPGAEQRAPGAVERAPGQQKTGAAATQGGRVQGGEAYGYAGREAQRGGVQLNPRQESRVRDIIEQRGGNRISRNEFDARIGAIAPPNVVFAPLPPDVVSIVPQYRGYDYVQVENEIAIIDPSDRRVVSMLDVGGPAPYGSGYSGYEEREGRYGGGGYERREGGRQAQRYGRRERGEAYGYAPRVRLDARQERTLYRGVMRQARENLRQVCVHVGDRVPDSVDLAPVPRNVALDAPDVERYDYFVLNDQVVLVDPDSHVVVDIIEEPK